ncbi:sugar porter family MFS transporter [Streptantibioticus cattleyicolor]|uniref:Sugar-transport integral membrane protein SugI n=1 Tax=Streptantibioticus cattleyicolor (strain ATCC 35852 / DSM 46488 / JCM 4925 / NBRC 14057 / NRRL 8057) TaxID=1003195 RepID=F8JMT3_STREN|nr:sugar porter family MFS transporter [Streptantibioticus cattleyicolor]AEW99281.1 sugar-transport integral membrane protein SugI [Streptantibioticus cattleyicolor NRRL 8057 = DSM 46488]CCB71679.1 putative sugar-transport integral membrane protein SugI [Streptantibioticus cattleyicolor NRRL 8057 = DSM 46488]
MPTRIAARPPHRGVRRAGRPIAVAGAVVGVVYGYDTGSVSGALVFLSREFHLGPAAAGLVNSVLVLGSVLGALVAGRLADAVGRRTTMIAVAAAYAVFAALSALSPDVVVLDAVRFLLGVAIGVSIVVAPLFIAESSPARVRGAAVATYQVACVAGITLTYFLDWALAGGGHWRVMLGLSALPAALVVPPLLRLPDSPRWYVLTGRLDVAAEVLAATDPDVDPVAGTAAIARELAAERTGRGGALERLVRRPYRRATVFVLGMGFFCQITGVNAVTYYSPEIFRTLGFTGTGQTFFLPSLVELVSLAATVAALFVVDRAGRRDVLLTGIGTMTATLVALALLYGAGAGSWAGFAAVTIFTAAFNFGFGSLIWVYASEAFPARLRSLGASVMLTADLTANLLVAQFFPALLATAGPARTFAGFAALALAAFVFIAWLAPETKGRPLEEIRAYWRNGGRWDDPAAAPPARP